jgi:hypothetical protein
MVLKFHHHHQEKTKTKRGVKAGENKHINKCSSYHCSYSNSSASFTSSSSSALQHSSSTTTSTTTTSSAPIYDVAHALYSIQVLRGVVGTEADINAEGRKGAKIKNPSRPQSKSSSSTSNSSSSSSSSSLLDHQPSLGELVKLAKIVWMVDNTPQPEETSPSSQVIQFWRIVSSIYIFCSIIICIICICSSSKQEQLLTLL